MTGVHATDQEAGKVFSNLYPFRESFYERLGYVAFPLHKIVRFPTRSLELLLKMDPLGEIRLQYIGEAYDTYREYLAELRKHRHGMAFFDFGDRGRVNQNLFWTAAVVIEGEIEGFMLYRTTGEEVGNYNFSATRFYYKTSRARYLMLNWIARHIDQAGQVEIWLPADEYPETWLPDLNMKVEFGFRPAMSRVVDVGKIGGMRVGEGNISAKIIDPLCPWNEGIWRFESMDGKLIVNPASTPDCELTIQALTALISGVHDPQDFPLRAWGDLHPRLQSVLRSMFSKQFPYMHEIF
jgi:predicted acetyltransferase